MLLGAVPCHGSSGTASPGGDGAGGAAAGASRTAAAVSHHQTHLPKRTRLGPAAGTDDAKAGLQQPPGAANGKMAAAGAGGGAGVSAAAAAAAVAALTADRGRAGGRVRAPLYSTGVDTWSIGCIFAELLGVGRLVIS
jgi:hypothetical protein